MICKQCNTEFEAKRADAQYCSPSCRKAASRLSVTSDTDKLSVTSPPCTPQQMTSPCSACSGHGECSYRKNQTTAVPGDVDYVGVV